MCTPRETSKSQLTRTRQVGEGTTPLLLEYRRTISALPLRGRKLRRPHGIKTSQVLLLASRGTKAANSIHPRGGGTNSVLAVFEVSQPYFPSHAGVGAMRKRTHVHMGRRSFSQHPLLLRLRVIFTRKEDNLCVGIYRTTTAAMMTKPCRFTQLLIANRTHTGFLHPTGTVGSCTLRQQATDRQSTAASPCTWPSPNPPRRWATAS